MDEVENKFLHAIDLDELKKETGMSLEELANLAEIGPKVIYKWQYMHKDSSRPSFNAIVRLLQKGATTKTLFGVDMSNGETMSNQVQKILDTPECREAIAKALLDVKNRSSV